MRSIIAIIAYAILSVVIPGSSSALVVMDSLTINNPAASEFYKLGDDMRVGSCFLNSNLDLNGHTLEVETLNIGSSAYITGDGILRVTGTASAYNLRVSEATVDVSQGAVLSYDREMSSSGFTFVRSTLHNNGRVIINSSLYQYMDMDGTGTLELRNGSTLTQVGSFVQGSVEGTGTLKLTVNSLFNVPVSHSISGSVDPTIMLSVSGSTLTMSSAVSALTSLTLSYATVNGGGNLSVGTLGINTSSIHGIGTIYVTEALNMEGDNTIDAKILTISDGSAISFSGGNLVREGDKWVYDVGNLWFGTGIQGKTSLAISSGSKLIIPFTLNSDWGPVFEDLTLDTYVGHAGGEAGTTYLTMGIDTMRLTPGPFALKINIVPQYSNFKGDILEVRGNIRKASALAVVGLYQYFENLPVGAEGVQRDFTITLTSTDANMPEMSILAGGDDGPVHVPQQSFRLSGAGSVTVRGSIIYELTNLPPSGYYSYSARVPIVVDMVPVSGQGDNPDYPMTLESELHLSFCSVEPPKEVQIRCNVSDYETRVVFFALPNLIYVVEKSTDLRTWTVVTSIRLDEPDYYEASFMDESLPDGSVFFRVRASK